MSADHDSTGRPPVAYILADVGSTTTKVVAVGDDPPRVLAQAFHPTTVEPPDEDAGIGFERGLEALSLGVESPFNEPPAPAADENRPRAMFTSSAAGGLKMLVVGLVQSITAESAQKASMGAGAVILDVLAVDDGRTDAERADLVRSLRPDLILVAGGFEGSSGHQILLLCEILAMGADPTVRLPLIFAGSGALAETVEDILSPYYDVTITPNLRPSAEQENFAPIIQTIQNLFMEHVMAHAPGYERISRRAHLGVVPTPLAVGRMVETLAEAEGTAVVALDIGGATTDVFSYAEGTMYRTVSANLGMSYSLGNTLVETGVVNFGRWIDPPIDERTLRNMVYSKVAEPTRFPITELEWQIDTAGAIEALRMALAQHLALTRTLAQLSEPRGGPLRSRESMAARMSARRERLSLLEVGLIIGSGGSLTYARTPRHAAQILLESLRPQGVTRLVLDTRSTLSHFGNLSRADRELAIALCRANLLELATVVSPVGRCPTGVAAVKWSAGSSAAGPESGGSVPSGGLAWLPGPTSGGVEVVFEPAPGLDLGAGEGRPLTHRVRPAAAGLIVDARHCLVRSEPAAGAPRRGGVGRAAS